MDRLMLEMEGLRPSSLTRSNAAQVGRKEERRARDLDKLSSAGQAMFLHLSYDKEIGRVVAQILDGASGAVVRQLPPEETVAFLKRLRQAVPLVDETV